MIVWVVHPPTLQVNGPAVNIIYAAFTTWDGFIYKGATNYYVEHAGYITMLKVTIWFIPL